MDWQKILEELYEYLKKIFEAPQPPQPPPQPPTPPEPPPPPVEPPEPPGPSDQYEGKYFTRVNLGKFAGGGLLVKSLGSGWYEAQVFFEWNEPYFLPCRVNINEAGQWWFSDSLAEARWIIDSNTEYWY